jgi:hypothetical protein
MNHSNASGIDIHNIHHRSKRLNVDTQTYPMDGYDYMGHSNAAGIHHRNFRTKTSIDTQTYPMDGYNYISADETGIKPVDDVITKSLEIEKTYLDRPLLQFAILGLAVYGSITLINKIS